MWKEKLVETLNEVFKVQPGEKLWKNRRVQIAAGIVTFLLWGVTFNLESAFAVLALLLFFIGLPYYLVRLVISSGRRKRYFVKFVAVFFVGFVCLLTGMTIGISTPEYKAKEAARVEQQKIKAEQDAELQKKYDDQKQYEEWLDWQKQQEQKKYDDQEKYEKYVAWQKQKQEQAEAKAAEQAAQKPYDDQKKYEEWIAWQKNALQSAVNVDSISVSDAGNGSYNVNVRDRAVLRTDNDVATYMTRDEVTLKKANMLDQCMNIVQKLQATGVPINYITITLTGKTQDINGYIYDNDDIAICEINGDAKFSSFEGFQNVMRRFATIDL